MPFKVEWLDISTSQLYNNVPFESLAAVKTGLILPLPGAFAHLNMKNNFMENYQNGHKTIKPLLNYFRWL